MNACASTGTQNDMLEDLQPLKEASFTLEDGTGRQSSTRKLKFRNKSINI